jgi:hypothetical protein
MRAKHRWRPKLRLAPAGLAIAVAIEEPGSLLDTHLITEGVCEPVLEGEIR